MNSLYILQIKGQYFTLDFTSTSDLPCPPSEFEVPGVQYPTEAPTDPAASSSVNLMVAAVATMMAFVALA
jgi:hypothetical protein